jgi:hypothetical protein
MVRNNYRTLSVILFCIAEIFQTNAQELAFPGAEGFGKFATGGRDGRILVVSNLNDDGPGSFREALGEDFSRIIVFKVSGTIALESPLDIKHGNVSVLGHSSPGDGIALKNYTLKATEVDNVIIRYIRSRLGDEAKYQGDAISIKYCKNIIIDHCSFSWASDECASIYDNEHSTVQFCLISESMNNSIHAKGEHGYGGIWGGKQATFHHNLFAHHKSRNPRFNGARYHKQPAKEIVDFRNNVIYNWGENNVYAGEEGNHNLVNNFYKAGPATISKKDKILDPYEPYGKFYLSGNILLGDAEVNENNWEGVNHFDRCPEAKLDQPIEVEKIETQPTLEAYITVLDEVGASYARDAVDKRIVAETRSGTATYGNGIIDSPSEVGGWPELAQGRVAKDSDSDGIPDKWEKQHDLEPRDHTDAVLRSINKDYSNIEVYVNSLLEK